MSYAFTLRPKAPIDGDVVRELLGDDVEIDGDVPEGEWPLDRWVHPYLPGLSTRGLEVGVDPSGGFVVRLLSMSSPEEVRHALAVVRAAAVRWGVPIEPDEAGQLDPAAFDVRFDDDWVADFVEQGWTSIESDATTRIFSMPGPTRAFHVGPRTRAKVKSADELLAAMRRLMWPDEDVYCAGVLVAQDRKFTALGPDVEYLLPPVEAVALVGPPGEGVPDRPFVPIERVPELVPSAEWLDDKHLHVPAVPSSEWAALCERAAAFAVASAAELPSAKNETSLRPEGTLLPVLRSRDWPHRMAALHEPLHGSPVPGMPLVSWGYDTGPAVAIVRADTTDDKERLRAEALANLERRAIQWVDLTTADGLPMGLGVVDEYASEALLSPTLMRAAAMKLGTSTLVAAAPRRGMLRLEPFERDGGRGLLGWAMAVWEEGGGGRLAPHVYVLEDGRIVGVGSAGPPADAPVDGGASKAAEPPKAPASTSTAPAPSTTAEAGKGVSLLWYIVGLVLFALLLALVWWKGLL